MRGSIKTWLPCMYFIGLGAYWLYDGIAGRHTINYIACSVIVIFIIQAVIKNKISGILLGIAALIISFLMFLAVLSAYNEYTVITRNARQLLITGTMLSIISFIMAGMLTSANIKKQDDLSSNHYLA